MNRKTFDNTVIKSFFVGVAAVMVWSGTKNWQLGLATWAALTAIIFEVEE